MSTPESTRAISQDRKKGKNVSALRGLLPFLKPYKILVATALFMLTFTAAISLILPLAVRGVVDGFSKDLDVLDDYFIYAIFNWLSPFTTLLFAALNIKIRQLKGK